MTWIFGYLLGFIAFILAELVSEIASDIHNRIKGNTDHKYHFELLNPNRRVTKGYYRLTRAERNFIK